MARSLVIEGLTKTFAGTRALNDVGIEILPGEIHGLVGGNGSGKSTLIKIVTGVYTADPGGRIHLNGDSTSADNWSPEQAKAAGIRVVHQDLGVFADMSVAENIALGYGYSTGFGARVKWSELYDRTARLIERFEIDASPDTPLQSLRHAARAQVAIARALESDDENSVGFLILDEPTSSLPAHEVDLLLSTLRGCAARGQGILYVSHRLDEVLSVTDRVTVLRDGINAGTFASSDLDEAHLIEVMVGRPVERVFPGEPTESNEPPILEVNSLSVGPLRDIDLVIRPGEIVGIAGRLGSGRSELLRALFGDLRVESGTIRFDGKERRFRRPAEAMASGVAYVPENRAADATFTDLPVYSNLLMTSIRSYWRRLHVRYRQMRSDARGLMRSFLIKAASEVTLLETLSGGNQQKVVIARWLRHRPKLLLLDEPTQGVDVAARAEIWGLVRKAVTAGTAALVVVSDFEELALVSDRVAILRDGRITHELGAAGLSATTLTHLMYEKAQEDG